MLVCLVSTQRVQNALLNETSEECTFLPWITSQIVILSICPSTSICHISGLYHKKYKNCRLLNHTAAQCIYDLCGLRQLVKCCDDLRVHATNCPTTLFDAFCNTAGCDFFASLLLNFVVYVLCYQLLNKVSCIWNSSGVTKMRTLNKSV